jgi:hypothetical protein
MLSVVPFLKVQRSVKYAALITHNRILPIIQVADTFFSCSRNIHIKLRHGSRLSDRVACKF